MTHGCVRRTGKLPFYPNEMVPLQIDRAIDGTCESAHVTLAAQSSGGDLGRSRFGRPRHVVVPPGARRSTGDTGSIRVVPRAVASGATGQLLCACGRRFGDVRHSGLCGRSE